MTAKHCPLKQARKQQRQMLAAFYAKNPSLQFCPLPSGCRGTVTGRYSSSQPLTSNTPKSAN